MCDTEKKGGRKRIKEEVVEGRTGRGGRMVRQRRTDG